MHLDTIDAFDPEHMGAFSNLDKVGAISIGRRTVEGWTTEIVKEIHSWVTNPPLAREDRQKLYEELRRYLSSPVRFEKNDRGELVVDGVDVDRIIDSEPNLGECTVMWRPYGSTRRVGRLPNRSTQPLFSSCGPLGLRDGGTTGATTTPPDPAAIASPLDAPPGTPSDVPTGTPPGAPFLDPTGSAPRDCPFGTPSGSERHTTPLPESRATSPDACSEEFFSAAEEPGKTSFKRRVGAD
ncbi:hypothetical protein QR680_006656 [Steinernema hermaphroditum]|uniref:Uncharacterized protein n=1 Tax=Steinernema hermaphroditum TaxID=289476 RepID=A0AA39LXG9_9BILA|nr:hypothetical protein QR680_006656 [Steinernema hermaphroditum]